MCLHFRPTAITGDGRSGNAGVQPGPTIRMAIAAGSGWLNRSAMIPLPSELSCRHHKQRVVPSSCRERSFPALLETEVPPHTPVRVPLESDNWLTADAACSLSALALIRRTISGEHLTLIEASRFLTADYSWRVFDTSARQRQFFVILIGSLPLW